MQDLASARIGVIGLGYVGLPLAVEFGKHYDTLGYDIDPGRIAALRDSSDHNREASHEELVASTHLRLSASIDDLRGRNVYIVTVPTPVDEHKRPDFSPLIDASRSIGSVLAPGDVVCLGISHPCTTLDKWRLITVLDDEDNVIDTVHTFF